MIFHPYPEHPLLSRYYFEDSWVLGIDVTNTSASVEVEAVMTPEHPDFGPPRPGEQYRYERIALRFGTATRVSFEPTGAPPAIDASGEADLGNIDTFEVGEAGAFLLEGRWGSLLLEGATLSIEPSR